MRHYTLYWGFCLKNIVRIRSLSYTLFIIYHTLFNAMFSNNNTYLASRPDMVIQNSHVWSQQPLILRG